MDGRMLAIGVLFVSATPVLLAAKPVTRLSCVGTYVKYGASKTTRMSVQNVAVKIGKRSIRISGIPYKQNIYHMPQNLNGMYVVTNKWNYRDITIVLGIQKRGNTTVYGSIDLSKIQNNSFLSLTADSFIPTTDGYMEPSERLNVSCKVSDANN